MADENNKANNHDHESYVKILTRDHSKTNSAQSKAANINILNSQIENQQKYFKWYSKIPLILAIIIFALSFITGIVITVAMDSAIIWLSFLIYGGAFAAIEYFIGRIIYSQKILTVLYLQKLNEDKQ